MDWISVVTQLIIPVLCAVLTAVVVPLIKDKRVQTAVKTLVEAAEQSFPAGSGEDKYAYVRTQLVSLFGLSEERAKAYIEAAVYSLKAAEAVIPASEADKQ